MSDYTGDAAARIAELNFIVGAYREEMHAAKAALNAEKHRADVAEQERDALAAQIPPLHMHTPGAAMASPDQIINAVEDHRDRIGAARKFPDGADCTIFAIGEGGGELFDAWMRQDRSFQRNNAREADPSKEAADLMYMTASAIIAIRRGNVGEVEIREEMLGEIVERLCYALLCLRRYQPGAALNNLEYALKHTLDLCAREHWHPLELLAAKAERDNARYLAPIREPNP